MNRIQRIITLAAALLLTQLKALEAAHLKPAAVFCDHAVLQRDKEIPVWGWADSGEKIKVEFAGQTKQAITDTAGKWMVRLTPLMACSESRDLKISGDKHDQPAIVHDVLVGEVWLGSGQSNMARTVREAKNFDIERANAAWPTIRMFKEVSKPASIEQADASGSWVACTSETVGDYSAVLYFFGRELHRELRVPVGLINSSVGGTPIESWVAADAQSRVPEVKPAVDAYLRENERLASEEAEAEYQRRPGVKKPWDWSRPRNQLDNRGGLGGLFNGKIAPLAPYALQGILWYQGEQNAAPGRGQYYQHQLPLLVNDWRRHWGEELPFAWVQLPNYETSGEWESGWILVREAMLKALRLPRTGMAVTVDIGEAKDIHPKNKQDVGQRLALWALGEIYGAKLPATSGPLPETCKVRGPDIVVSFKHTGGGLRAKQGELTGFLIAGEDRHWKPAQARVEKETVIVSNPDITNPVAVRYDWAANPDGNLYNGAGLPASPFRTDDWPVSMSTSNPTATLTESACEKANVFVSGLDGVTRYRIPGIVVTVKGTILAYCEARLNGAADWGEIAVHMRRSTDGAKTWEATRQVAHLGTRVEGNPAKKTGGEHEQTVNNPVAIVDRETGTIVVLYCLNYARCFQIRSTDDGVTWSEPTEITKAFEPFRAKYNWKVIATGPGHGIQLKTGRLVVPIWLAYGDPGEHAPSAAGTIYSDDHGQTWKAGDIAVPNEGEFTNPNESMIAELADGTVMLVSRNKSVRNRKLVSYSPNGATQWSVPAFHDELWEPICMSSLISCPSRPGTVLFSGVRTLPVDENGNSKPGSLGKRENLSILVSHDSGKSWPTAVTVEAGPSAYSDLALLPDGSVLCLYEGGKDIRIARFEKRWLASEGPATTLPSGVTGQVTPGTAVTPVSLVLRKEIPVNGTHLIVPIANGRDGKPFAKDARNSMVLGMYDAGRLVQSFHVTLPEPGDASWLAAYPLDRYGLGGKVVTLAVVDGRQAPAAVATAFDKIRVGGADDVLAVSDYAKPYRNQFHASTRRGWNNDPNGMCFHDGMYHLYYQHNPLGIFWGNMHWGHMESGDLLHWEEKPIALYQNTVKDRAYSGSGFVDVSNSAGKGAGTLFVAFTSTGRGECLAYSKDGGLSFTELNENPVVKHHGRDPKVLWYAPQKKWVMAVFDGDPCEETRAIPQTAGTKERENCHVAFYESHDLRKWTHTGDFTDGDRAAVFECPELFELPVAGKPETTRWILLAAENRYFIGEFDGKTFRKEAGPLGTTHGVFYAAQTFSDVLDGRRIQVGWVRTHNYLDKFPDQITSQAFTLPHELRLRETCDGLRMSFWPVEEIERLRGDVLAEASDLTIEQANRLLRQCEGGLTETLIEFTEPCIHRVVINGIDASFEGRTARIFSDRTFNEVYVDEGLSYEVRNRPVDGFDVVTSHLTAGEDAAIRVLKVYRLKSIWPQ